MDIHFTSISVYSVSQDVQCLTSYTCGFGNKPESEWLSDPPYWTVIWLFPRDVTTQWKASLRLDCQVRISDWMRGHVTRPIALLIWCPLGASRALLALRTWEAGWCRRWMGLEGRVEAHPKVRIKNLKWDMSFIGKLLFLNTTESRILGL